MQCNKSLQFILFNQQIIQVIPLCFVRISKLFNVRNMVKEEGKELLEEAKIYINEKTDVGRDGISAAIMIVGRRNIALYMVIPMLR